MLALLSRQPTVYDALVREGSVLECLQSSISVGRSGCSRSAHPRSWPRSTGQGELKVHDVAEVQSTFDLGLALASLYGPAAPWLVRRRGAGRAARRARRRRLPRGAPLRRGAAKFGEWPGTCFAAALCVFALLAWRRIEAGK